MANAQALTQLADNTAREITGSYQRWTAFLTTAARLYKYPYHEQLMIFAQRPDATACAEYDLWNNRMRRYVRRGSRGIALIDNRGDIPRIRYVFDVSDTGERQNSLRPNLWELQDQHMNAVHDALAERFGADDFMVAAQLERIANTMAQNYWEEHRQEIIDIVDGSYLADYDEFNIGVSFRNAAGVSIAYSLMSRCGLEPEDEFLHEDFLPVFDWNTPAAAAALGTAVSDISEQVLRTIEVTIRNEERRLENERTANEQPDLSAQRGLSDSQSDPGRDARNTPDEVRQDAKEIPAGAQADPVQSADTEREITAASAGDAGNRTEPDQSDGERDGEEQRRNGNPESSGRDGLGGPDEYASDAGGRNDSERPDLRIEEQAEQLSLFPPETEQIEQIDRMITTSAERPKPSALVLSEEDIDLVLRRGSGYENGKIRIAAMYAGNPSPKEALEFLKDEYGIGGYSHTYLDGTGGFVDYNGQGLRLSQRGFSEETRLRWPAVEQRIRRMIESGTYLTEKEQEHFAEMQRTYAGEALPAPHARMIYPPPLPDAPVKEHSTSESVSDEEPDWMDDIDPAAIREHLAESGIVNGEVVDPEALARNPFIQQVEADVAAIAAEEAAQTEAETPEQDISPPRPGERRIPAHDGIPAMREITIDLTGRNREPEPPVPDQSESAAWTPSEFSYDLHPGDTIYMDDRPFVVEDVRLSEVSFRDPSMVYPIFRVESKYILERILLPRDERNNQYRISPAHQQVSQQTGFSESPNVPLANESAEQSSSPESPSVLAETATNFRITDDHLGEGGQKTKYENNIRAIRTLKTLEKEHRPASPEDQEVLSKYVGWGGIPQAFDENNPSWSDKYRELKSLLTEEEYEMARASTLNAHYTSPTVIRAMYEALEQMGFRTGNVLEPSCGVGNFFGLLPESMTGSHLYGVELDSITGRIAQYLYPQAQIEVTGFEKTDRKDFFDVAVGNVPFGSYKLVDRQFDRYNFLIHDYFFAKALDQVRPGGIIAFITSKGTMDKQSPEVRKYIAQRAELLGAIRLPNSAFKANAGTEVTSDILFLQKRDHPIEIEPDWVHLGETVDGIPVNAYFAEHPEMVLGTMTWDDSMYGSKQETACLPIEGASLANQLHEAVSHIIGQYQAVEMPDLADGEAIRETIPADPSVRNYSYTVVDGNVYYRENSVMVRPELNATAQERVKGMVALRDCVYTLMDMQLTEASDKQIQAQQAELNRLYDDFTAKYGLLNSRGNAQAFSDDSSYYLLCSLEVLDEDGRLERKADMFSKRTIRQQRVVEHVDTASEALALSIAEKAKVDLSYMAELTGLSEESIADELTGVIFRLPAPVGEDGKPQFVTADEYLSGNVRQKLREARAAAEIAPIFEPNVRALEAAQPKDLDASEIDVRLGATWIDKDYIQQFMEELCEIPFYQKRAIRVQFSEYTAEWHINGKNIPSYSNVAVNMTYGTDRANALKILEDTLNLRDVRIYDTVTDPDGKERRVLNQKETTLAQQKQQAIKDAFRDWIWQDPYRRQALVEKYNEMFNSTRPREYDGQHITFSGMNPEITLREHQRNAVAHILYGGNTLLAHEVGAGKTFEMIAAAMESKRLGLCQKPMFVVPNHLTEQWASEFLRLYPSANILVTTKKDFEKANRRKFCARIATGDYDAVIIGHSQFERIPMSQERQERLLREQIDEITAGIDELKHNRGEQFSIKQLERTRKQLEGRLRKLQAEEKKDDVVTFEQLGVDRLYVDEAHLFKNLFLYTKMRNVAGLSTTEAQKSSDMFMKCRYIDELTDGRGVVFATGTPVSNSMTELYPMQRYLQYFTLKRNNLSHFDAWASTFGETTTAIELAPEGTGYRARTRFAKFFNLPELMTLFKEVADIKTADQLHLPTPTPHFETIVVKPTEHQQAMVQELSKRAALVHGGSVDPRVDNMLKITSDGRKLGLDQRLINPLLPDDPASKVNACVGNIFRIWDEGQDRKLTQLVFCDISTPKGNGDKPLSVAAKAEPVFINGVQVPGTGDDEPTMSSAQNGEFSVYEDIRAKLIARGIPAEQIAFIHDANTEVKKKELFAKVRSGQVRVLMGSTAKMGAGTNVQDRLIALHDVDCPWRPGDLEQRAGRIVRQGNSNPDVQIYRYVTEGTFDAYLWQTVENKQKFISQIMTSKSPVRSCEDVDETALSYAEIKALCAGDPRIREKMDLDVDVARLRLMKADHQTQHFRLEDKLLKYFPQEIEKQRGYIAAFQQDMQTLTQHPLPADKEDFVGMDVKGDHLIDKDNAGAAILEACKTLRHDREEAIGSYRGFSMNLMYDSFSNQFILTLRGAMSHRVELGTDARGNLIRIENALNNIPKRMEAVHAQMTALIQQQETAKIEVEKPFPQEEELRTKSARLAELDASLNIDGRPEPAVVADEPSEERMEKHPPRSLSESLRQPCQLGQPKPKREMEAR